MAAGITDDEAPDSGPELVVKGVSVDVRASDLKLAEQLAAYLNALAEVRLEASTEKGVEIDKRESRRSVLKDALHTGIKSRVMTIVHQAKGEALPPADDLKAMKAYAARVEANAKAKALKANGRG